MFYCRRFDKPQNITQRIADRRPDGIGSRYLSEINKLWEKTTETFEGGGKEEMFGPLQWDCTVVTSVVSRETGAEEVSVFIFGTDMKL